MKLRFSLLGLLSLALLTACPPPPKPVASGWAMDFRGGTINLDSSAASGAAQDETYGAALQKTLERYTGLQMRLPTQAQTGVKPQASIATGVSFYVALQQNGGLPTESATLEFRGPQKTYSYVDQTNQPTKPVYGAGVNWFYSQVQTSQGSGVYHAQAEVSTGIVSAQTNINTSEVLNPPSLLEVGASPDGTLAADWGAIPNAKSYLAIVYDLTAKKVVWSGVGKGNSLEIFSGLTVNPNNSYDLTISAFNFEIDDSPKAPALTGLEANVNSVIFRKQFGVLTPSLRIERKDQQLNDSSLVQLFPVGKPNNEAIETFKIINAGGGALRYELELPSDANLVLTTGLRGSLRGGAGRNLVAKSGCGANESERTVTGQLKTNSITMPIRTMVFRIECVRVVAKANEVWKKLPGINNPSGIALSPDGTKLLLGGSEGIRMWDVATNRIIYSVNTSLGSFENTMTWKPDSTAFAYLSGNQIVIRDAINFNALLTVDMGSSIPNGVLWSPDGSRILVNGYFAKIIDASSGAVLAEVANWRGDITHIKWSPNSASIVAFVFNNSLNSKNITIWNSTTGTISRQIPVADFVSGIAWSADSSRLVGGGTNKVTFWSVTTGQEVSSLSFPSIYSNIVSVYSWDTNDQRLVLYLQDKLRTVSATTGVSINEYDGSTPSIASSAQRIAAHRYANNGERQVRIFSLDTGAEIALIDNPAQQIQKIEWHPNGDAFAVLVGQTARIMNKSGVFLRELPTKSGFFWSRDGNQYATSDSSNSKLQLRDSLTGNLVRELAGSSEARQVVWSQNGDLVAVQEFTGTRVFNVASGAEVWGLADGRSLSVNANGTKLLVRIGESFSKVVIQIFNFSTGLLERTVDTTNVSFFFSLAWSSNEDRFLAYGGVAGGLVRMFDLALGNNYLVNISGGGNTSYQWSNDARRLFLVNRIDSTNFGFAVASPVSGDVAAPLLTLTGSFLAAPHIAVSPDGTTLITSFDNSGVALYDLTYSP
jgi:hypothetical protein